jgi:hypothetical protein
MPDEPVVIPRGRKRAFTCALCGAYLYACTHTALTIVAPADTDRDATALIVNGTSTASDTGMVVVFNAITEQESRVDMPWLKGFMTTKRST